MYMYVLHVRILHVCMNVCTMYVPCMYVCARINTTCVHIHVPCMYVLICTCMNVCMNVCIVQHTYIHVCMYE